MSQICLPYFGGQSPSAVPEDSGQICISVKDGDTVRQLVHGADIVVTVPQSIHLSDNATSYQNNSGFDAMIIFIVNVGATTGVPLPFEVYNAPTDDSIAAATKVFENDGISGTLLLTGDRLTVGPFKISNGNYCVINTTLAGNAINISHGFAWVVERTV